MTKLTLTQKQSIAVGAFPILGAATIKLIHGLITLSWIGLEIANLASDSLIKTSPKNENNSNRITIENNLQSSRITISS